MTVSPLVAYAVLAAAPALGLTVAHLRHRALTRELAQARYAATHDALTGLLNRAGWHAHAPTLMNRAAVDERPVAVVLVDVDNLKTINDKHGHEAGDQAITAIADDLAARVGVVGLTARLGGDEFAALLVSPLAGLPTSVWASATTARIADRLSTIVRVGDQEIGVSASVGAAPLTAGAIRSADLTEALREADADMYRNKARRPSAQTAA
jgi:diguanylate cyclase (GGDEF)-like protein